MKVQNSAKNPTDKLNKGMRNTKETWIEKQYQGIEKKNLQKNNSNKADQFVKELASSKQGRTTNNQDKAGKRLRDEQDILKRRTQYCFELYTHTPTEDPKVLDVPPPINNDSCPILCEEVEVAVKSPKNGESAGVDKFHKIWSRQEERS